MATGDNVLTAISVARQCKMLDPEKTVFLGELIEEGGRKLIQWSTTGGVSDSPAISSEDKLPWHYTDSTIEVALTGPAFRHIRE